MGHLDNTLLGNYWAVRSHTESLCAELTAEDQCIQSMPDASPAKWHLAHTTWFFEQFLLLPNLADYRPFSQDFTFLFNSYYESVGARHPRFARGMITRPGAEEVSAYRKHVNDGVAELLRVQDAPAALVGLGLHHEQQHQELLITDMLHAFWQNPLFPAMLSTWAAPQHSSLPDEFVPNSGGLVTIGYGGQGFSFDNERPCHQTFIRPFGLARCLVRNSAWLEFMRDGGYRKPTLWMSEGWATVLAENWQSPLYWRESKEGWECFGPGGIQPVDWDAPVRHVSWYEADAFSRWAGYRLPTESEWEAASTDQRLEDMHNQVWQWTGSAYLPYPGFRPVEGAIGEYNGKFMINQMVLRGGSMATSPGHTRPTYRNFFHPDRRWQFTGLRLAKDV